MIAQVPGGDGDRLEVFALLVFFAATPGSVEAIEQDLFPVYLSRPLVFGLCLRLFLGLSLLLLFLFFLRLDEIQERIVEELLLQVLLQVQQRHVEKIHRLIKAWIDLELLAELGRLIEARLQEELTCSLARENLSRSRAVSVGPR